MKNKIFYSIVFILNILISIFLIFNVQNIIDSLVYEVQNSSSYSLTLISENPGEYVAYLQNAGKIVYYMIFFVNLVSSIAILVYVNKCNILRKKWVIFGFLIFYFISFSEFIGIISYLALFDLIVAIILACTKRKNEEDFPIKRTLPTMEEFKYTKLEKIFMAVLALLYAIYLFFPISKIIKFENNNEIIIFHIFIYVIFMAVTIVAFRRKIVHDFKDIAKNLFDYMMPTFKTFLVFMAIYFVVSVFMHVTLNIPLPENEDGLRKLNPIFILLAGAIYAPLVEESIFRNILHMVLKNKYVFIILSALIFGGIHVMEESSLSLAIVQLIPYSILGAFFAYNYDKSKNIVHNMLWHGSWNIVVSIITMMFTA